MSQEPTDRSRRFTDEEYFAREETSEERHEFHDGQIIAMAGGSAMHSRIISNVIGELHQRLKESPCSPFDSNLRLRIERFRKNVYPDAMVVCGEMQYYERDKSKGTILNARVVVEVLSPSTATHDRTEKLQYYLSVPTIDCCVLIEQDVAHVAVMSRRSDGSWSIDFAHGPDGVAKLPTLEIELPLSEIYARVEFPESKKGEESAE